MYDYVLSNCDTNKSTRAYAIKILCSTILYHFTNIKFLHFITTYFSKSDTLIRGFKIILGYIRI